MHVHSPFAVTLGPGSRRVATEKPVDIAIDDHFFIFPDEGIGIAVKMDAQEVEPFLEAIPLDSSASIVRQYRHMLAACGRLCREQRFKVALLEDESLSGA